MLLSPRPRLSSTQMLLEFGVAAKSRSTVITPLVMSVTRSFSSATSPSTVPSGKITYRNDPVPKFRSVLAVSSTVIVLLVADLMRPPLRAPEITGSAIWMICPGRTVCPASRLLVKLTTSFSNFSEYRIHLPMRAA